MFKGVIGLIDTSTRNEIRYVYEQQDMNFPIFSKEVPVFAFGAPHKICVFPQGVRSASWICHVTG